MNSHAETALHLSRLAEVAAVAGAHHTSVQFALSHVASLLDDMESDDNGVEVNAAREYADNAAHIAHTTPEACHEAIHLLVLALADLKDRVDMYERYDALGAEMPTHKICDADTGAFICYSPCDGIEPTYRTIKIAIDGGAV